jgi:hypothetical protein
VFNRPTPEPRYWKSLVITIIFVLPLALFFRWLLRIPDLIWTYATLGVALIVSWAVHTRMRDDWRAGGTMALSDFHNRTTVARNIRIKRR